MPRSCFFHKRDNSFTIDILSRLAPIFATFQTLKPLAHHPVPRQFLQFLGFDHLASVRYRGKHAKYRAILG